MHIFSIGRIDQSRAIVAAAVAIGTSTAPIALTLGTEAAAPPVELLSQSWLPRRVGELQAGENLVVAALTRNSKCCVDSLAIKHFLVPAMPYRRSQAARVGGRSSSTSRLET